MKELLKKTNEQIASKTKLIKELKKLGKENRAFMLFEEVQDLKKKKANITAFNKI